MKEGRERQDSGVVRMWIYSNVHIHEYVVESNVNNTHTRNCTHLTYIFTA